MEVWLGRETLPGDLRRTPSPGGKLEKKSGRRPLTATCRPPRPTPSDVGRLLDEVRQRISALQLGKKVESILRQVGRQSPQPQPAPPGSPGGEEGQEDGERYTKAILPRPVLHANLREGRHLEKVVGGLERQRRDVVRRYTILKANELRTLKRAMTRSAALPLPPQQDRKRRLPSAGDKTPTSTLASPDPPPPSPETDRRRSEEALPGAQARWRSPSSVDDRKPEVPETPVEDADVGEGDEPEEVRHPGKGLPTTASLSERIEQQTASRRGSSSSSRSSTSLSPQPMVLPPVYLYPRATLRCDRLSEEAVRDLEDSGSKKSRKGRGMNYRRLSRVEIKSWHGSTGGMHLQGLRQYQRLGENTDRFEPADFSPVRHGISVT